MDGTEHYLFSKVFMRYLQKGRTGISVVTQPVQVISIFRKLKILGNLFESRRRQNTLPASAAHIKTLP